MQPTLDYALIHKRFAAAFVGEEIPSVEGFQQRCEAITKRLEMDTASAGIFSGVHVPFLLPRNTHDDIGESLQERYLPALKRSFAAALPDYDFIDHHTAALNGQLTTVEGSRHERLILAMQQGAVVGWYFPCFAEYSVPAMLERIATLPDYFLLAGGYDTCAALIGSPDLLLRRDGYPPLLWLSALNTACDGEGYHFEAYGYNLTFNRRMHFNEVAEYWNGGLVVFA